MVAARTKPDPEPAEVAVEPPVEMPFMPSGPDFVPAVLEAEDIVALREIAIAAAALVSIGIPTTSEVQAQAAIALQRAVYNLRR